MRAQPGCRRSASELHCACLHLLTTRQGHKKRRTMHNIRKLFLLLAPILLLAVPAAAQQSGLISGVVVAVTDEDGQPESDVTVHVGDKPIGDTNDDGTVTIGLNEIDEGERVTVRIRQGDETSVHIDKEGENHCDDDEADEAEGEEDDDACVVVGYQDWKRGYFNIRLGDDPWFGYDDGNDNGMTDMGDDDRGGMDDDGEGGGFGIEIGLGYNFDFEYGGFTVRGFAEEPIDALPLDFEVGFEFMPATEFNSILTFMLDTSYGCNVTEDIELYGAAGLRVIRWSFDSGAFSSSTSETGFALRGGARYPVGPVDLFGEVGISFAYGSNLPEVRGGARYQF